MIMAGGNTRQYTNQGQINGRTFDSQTEMICVAAVDQFGDVTNFSSYGATNLVSAFGTGLMTTDRLGNEGYSADEFNPSFGGTSGAAPQSFSKTFFPPHNAIASLIRGVFSVVKGLSQIW